MERKIEVDEDVLARIIIEEIRVGFEFSPGESRALAWADEIARAVVDRVRQQAPAPSPTSP